MWTCTGVLLALVVCAKTITRDQFYPYGQGLDLELPKGQETASPEIPLNVPIVFYGETYESFFVNNYGVISFRSDIPSFLNSEFPLPYPSIAAFYSNIDTSVRGTIYYRETNDTHAIAKANEDIQGNFPEYYDFQATSIVVATWLECTYEGTRGDPKNSFQIAIISNGTESFVELLYPEREIQWIQGEISLQGAPDAKAQAGFIAEDGRVFSLRGSGSHQIRNIVSWTNTHEPGKYLYRVGVISRDGNIAVPDQYTLYDVEDEEEYKTCAQSGPSICHIQARCVDYQAGICCQCNDGYYGNGKSCIKDDVPLRVHGKLFGEVNGIPLNEVSIQAYVIVAEGKSYTALSQTPPTLGPSLQSLNVLGSVIGWLFAKPVGNSKNGYQLTGSLFNHSADIYYPKTGDRVTIRQEFLGHDVFDQITLESDVRGTIPIIDSNDKLELSQQDEQYTRVEAGLIRSESTRTFTAKRSGIQYEQRISQTFSFKSCRNSPTTEEDQIPQTLTISKNYLGYEVKENIVRYGMSNKIVPLGEEDPCIKGRATCGHNSACIAQGESFKCICNNGYTIVYQPEGETCADFDECSANTHNCDANADCVNHNGGFSCRCKVGYRGDGVNCISQDVCSTKQCVRNAQCFIHYGEAVCMCRPGYTGNGNECWPITELSCEERNNCSRYAACVFSSTLHTYVCECLSGYYGDGYSCSVDRESTTSKSNQEPGNGDYVMATCNEYECSCPPHYFSFIDERGTTLCHISSSNLQVAVENKASALSCSDDTDCPPNAVCQYSTTSRAYECHCPEGYEGDGFECIENTATGCEICGANAHCVNSLCVCDIGHHGDGYFCRPNLGCTNNSDCEYNAECRLDASSQEYVCQCIDGYTKDQNDACIVAGNLCNDALCAEHALCLWDSNLSVNYCQCDSGYEGDGVEKCAPKGSSCEIANDCSTDAVCMRNEYNYECVCKEGFNGDGYNCVEEQTCRSNPYLCDSHASCLGRIEGFICECNNGYHGNGTYCDLNPRQPGNFLITTSGMIIYKVPFEAGTKVSTPISVIPEQFAVGMDVDCQTGRVYWGDIVTNTIKSSAYDGSGVESFLTTDVKAPEGISIDWVSRNLFWTDARKLTIEVMNLDSKIRRTLFSNDNIHNPRGIAAHPQKGKFFWSDWHRSGPKIEWANMDGTGREVFLGQNDVILPNSLAIDWLTDRLCYADSGLKSIECVNIDTRQRETIADKCTYPFGLAITEDKFYWTDWKSSSIEYIERNSLTRGTAPIAISGGKLYGLTVALDRCLNLYNHCLYSGGNCTYNNICLPNGRGYRTCV